MKPRPYTNRLTVALRRRRRACVAARLACGLLQWCVVASSVWLGLFLLDNAVALPGGLRLFGTCLAAVATLVLFVRFVVVPARRYPTLDRFAVYLESLHEVPRNRLINALQLQRRSHTGAASAFVPHTVRTAEDTLTQCPPRAVLNLTRLRRWSMLTLLAILAWGAYDAAAPVALRNAARRFARPLSQIDPVGRLRLDVVPAADCAVLPGDDLHVYVRIATEGRAGHDAERHSSRSPFIIVRPGRAAISDEALLRGAVRMDRIPPPRVSSEIGSRPGAGAEHARNLPSDWLPSPDGRVFHHTIRRIESGRSFRVFAAEGRASSRTHRVRVATRPRVVRSTFVVTPPEYTGRAARERPGPPDPLVGLPGSRYQVALQLDTPVRQLEWNVGSNRVFFSRADTATSWTAGGSLNAAGLYSITGELSDLPRSIAIARGNLLLLDDLPPQVEIAGQGRRVERVAGGTLTLRVSAADDFGIAELGLSTRPRGADATAPTETWSFAPPPGYTGRLQKTIHIPLRPSRFPPGGDYVVEAVCRDFSSANPPVRSEPLVVHVQHPREERPSDTDPALRTTQEALADAIAAQETALAVSRNMRDYLGDILQAQRRDYGDPNAYARHVGELADVQRDVGRHVDRAITSARKIQRAAPPLATFLDTIRTYPIRQAVEQIAGLSRPTYWYEPEASRAAHGSFSPGNDGCAARFPARAGRYAIFQGTVHPPTGQLAFAELELLDESGDRLPRRFVQTWNVSPITNRLVEPRVFPRMRAADIRSVIDAARAADPRYARRPMVHPARLTGASPSANVAYYMMREITSETPREIVLHARTADALRVWLNGWLLAEKTAVDRAAPATYRIRLELRAGPNPLLLELSAPRPGGGVAVRLTTPQYAPLALGADGHPHPVRDWRVVHAHPPDSTSDPTRAIDMNPSTGWEVEDAPALGLIVDLGMSNTVCGIRCLFSTNALRDYAFRMVNRLIPGQTLPPRLRTLIRLQELILDRLAALRGEELAEGRGTLLADTGEPAQAAAEESLDGSPAPESVTEGVASYIEHLDAFQTNSRALSTERNNILDATAQPSGADVERLERIKQEEMQNATRLADAAAVLDETQTRPEDPARAEARERLRANSRRLSGLADRKAALPPRERSHELDRDIDRVADAIRRDAQEIRSDEGGDPPAKARRPGGELKSLPRGTGMSPGELVERATDVDRRQHELRDAIDAVENALANRSSRRGAPRAGTVTPPAPTGQEAGVGSPGRAAAGGRAKAGPRGPATGETAGESDGAAPSGEPSDGPPPDRASSAEQDAPSQLAEGDTAGRTGNGTGYGRLPAAVKARMSAVSASQQAIREDARRIAEALETRGRPAGQVRAAVQAMQRVEQALLHTNAPALGQAYAQAAAYASRARQQVREAVDRQVSPVRASPRPASRRHIRARATPPKDYEEMVAAYFRKLAGEEADVPRSDDTSE